MHPSGPSGDGGRDARGPSPEVVAGWVEAERQLYPLAATTPHLYEQGIRVARAVADRLGDVVDLDGLSPAWERRGELLSRVRDEGIDVPEGPVGERLAGAGFALRYNELKVDDVRRAQRARIDQARRDGDAWVWLGGRGSLDGGLFDPFHAVDMHLASGLAIVQAVEVDQRSGGASYTSSVIRLDRDSGEVLDLDPGVAEPTEVSRSEAHLDAVAARRSVIEAASVEP